MVTLIELARTAANDWGAFFNDRPALQTAITFAHLGGMLAAGGIAIAADRTTLRGSRGNGAARAQLLGDLASVHPLVLGGLAVTIASGVLLLAADLDALLASPVLWVKMALLVALLGNGWSMTRAERGLRGALANEKGWAALRRRALTSLALWFAVVLSGTMLLNAS